MRVALRSLLRSTALALLVLVGCGDPGWDSTRVCIISLRMSII